MAYQNNLGTYQMQQPFYNQQVNAYNPYNSMMQPATNFQQQPQMPAQNQFLHFISNEQDILVKDIPMDGNVGFFVQTDLRKIYAKTWKDGVVKSNTYVLADEPQAPQEQDPFQALNERLDRIESCLNHRNRSRNRKPQKPEDQNGDHSQ